MSDHKTESHKPKSHSCGCGGDHTKHLSTQHPQEEKAVPSGDRKSEDTHHRDDHSGCCGGEKATK